MQSVKMIYRNSPMAVGEECLVYAIHQTHDLEACIGEVFATAWLICSQQWVTAPMAYFTPVLTKVLNE